MEIAKRALDSVIKTVKQKESACQQIQVFTDPDNPRQLLIIEKWDSKEIFLGSHLQTHHMKAFMKLAASFIVGKAEFTFWDEILAMT